MAKEVLELTLHFNGHVGFALNEHLQTVVRDALAMKLLSVGIPDRRYLGIKSFGDVCYTGRACTLEVMPCPIHWLFYSNFLPGNFC